MTSWTSNQVIASMVHEWKLIGTQGTISAVALTVLSCVDLALFSYLRWPCKFFAVYRICKLYESPASSQGILPSGRIMANAIAFILLTILTMSILHVKAELNDGQKDRYGNMLQAIIEFLWVISVFNLFRGIFMFLDSYVSPGGLSGMNFPPAPYNNNIPHHPPSSSTSAT